MDPRSLTRDFREFLQCLNEHRVEYLLIGGHAVAFHGYPRATGDLERRNKEASGRYKGLADLENLP